jgi:hypothetical protein
MKKPAPKAKAPARTKAAPKKKEPPAKKVAPANKVTPKKAAPAKSTSRIQTILLISAGIVLALIIAAAIAIKLIVTQEFIESKMEAALNRQVSIDGFSGGLFAAVSGFEIRDVRVSNYRTAEQLKALSGKPVADADLFAALGSIKFSVSIPPLLSGRFVLNELTLGTPVINVVRYQNGRFNFSDLLDPKPGASKEVKKEEPKPAKAEPAAPAKPLSADDIPVAIAIGKIGMEKGTVNFTEMTSGQKVTVYNLTTLVHSIMIDPKDLANKDSVGLKVTAGIKTVGRAKSGSVESFDIGLDMTGTVIPFDKKTRLLTPEARITLSSPYGSITGLQIFNEMLGVEQLAKYAGRIDFLKKEINWKQAALNVHYKNPVATLSDGRITTDDYGLTFGGSYNTAAGTMDIKSDMSVAAKHADAMKKKTADAAAKLITGRVKDYLKPADVADTAMKPLLNDKGEIFLRYAIKGTPAAPKVALVEPKLGSLKELVTAEIKKAGSKALDAAKDKAKEKAGEELKKQSDKQKRKATDSLKKLL